MKYLRTYNESTDNIINDLKDICLELEDDGYFIYVQGKLRFRITIYKKVDEHCIEIYSLNKMSYSDSQKIFYNLNPCVIELYDPILKEAVQRMERYMNSIGYYINLGETEEQHGKLLTIRFYSDQNNEIKTKFI